MTEKIKKKILLVDAMNLFCRHYIAHPQVSSLGQPMGGVVGFLYTLRRLVEQQRPNNIIVAWEGGGSARRRALFPEYKGHRRPVKLNRFYEDDIPNTVENRDDQVKSLVACLKHVPVCQIYVGNCEADDVIGYLCRTRYRDEDVTIVSSDKDFYQLLNATTKIYRPGKKVFVTKEDMLQEFGISPCNFPIAKAICGDSSDNIPGVKGIGFKTLAKRFPAMAADDDFNVDLLMTESQKLAATSKVKAFKLIQESEELIRRNLKLVDLDGTMLSPDQVRKIDFAVDTFAPTRNKISLIRELVGLGLGEFNTDNFYYTMTSITEG